MIVVPEFCRDKNVIATDFAVNYPVFDAFFVAVKSGGIDKAITCFNGFSHAVHADFPRGGFVCAVTY